MLRLIMIVLLTVSGRAEIIDRIAVTVGQQVITEQQLNEEVRVTAFLNRAKLDRGLTARTAAADRLIQQLLVRREMELSHYPLPEDEDIDKYSSGVLTSFGSSSDLSRRLAEYDVTQQTLRDHLALQLTTLRFIQFRFRPDIGISDTDVQAYYEREIPAWKANHPGATPPALANTKEAIRNNLLEQRTDEVLNAWLEETRKQVTINYQDRGLR